MLKHILNKHPHEALEVTGERCKREQLKRQAAAAAATAATAGAGAGPSKRTRPSRSKSAPPAGYIYIKMDRATLLKATTTLCSVNGRPSKIVEDSGLRMLIDPIIDGLRRASPEDVPVVNRMNVRQDVSKAAEELREKVRAEVKDKLVCLKLDTASRLNRKVLCINIQYSHEGALQLRMLAMIETFESHTSSFLKDKIMETLSQFGIPPSNVYTGTTDNGSNVKKAVSLLPSLNLQSTLTQYGCHHSFLAEHEDEAAGSASNEGEDDVEAEDDPEYGRSASASESSADDQTDGEGDDGGHLSGDANGESADEDAESDRGESPPLPLPPPPLEEGVVPVPAPDCAECRKLKAALGDMGTIHVSCAAHTLQLAVKDAVKRARLDPLFRKARRLAKKLRTSKYAARLEALGLPKAILDVETRWGSSHDMLEVLRRLKDACNDIAREEKDARLAKARRRGRAGRTTAARARTAKNDLPNLSQAEWLLLEEVCEALKPAKVATLKLQKEQLTAGDFYDAWLTCKETTRRRASPVSLSVVAAMDAREKSLVGSDAFAAALFMDPRYRCLLERDPALVRQAMVSLEGLWLRLNREAAEDTPPPLPPPAAEGTEDLDPVELLLRETEGLSSGPTTPGTNIAALLSEYRTWPRVNKMEDVLKFWESKKESDPELYMLATVVLSVPMTQVSVERTFSHLRQILSILRFNLSASAIADILF